MSSKINDEFYKEFYEKKIGKLSFLMKVNFLGK